MKTYENLDNLLKCHYPAKAYFSSLPDSVTNAVRQNGGRIHTAADLMNCVEGIIHEYV